MLCVKVLEIKIEKGYCSCLRKICKLPSIARCGICFLQIFHLALHSINHKSHSHFYVSDICSCSSKFLIEAGKQCLSKISIPVAIPAGFVLPLWSLSLSLSLSSLSLSLSLSPFPDFPGKSGKASPSVSPSHRAPLTQNNKQKDQQLLFLYFLVDNV